MKHLPIALAASLLATCGAIAADIPARPASAVDFTSPASVYDWSGLYAGVHAGYGWGSINETTTFFDPAGAIVIGRGGPIGPTVNAFDLKGWLGGVQAGYNLQSDNLVFGLEGDVSGSNVNGSFQFDPTRPEAVAGGTLDWVATLRGRLGYAFDNTLVYATAGLAYAHGHGYVNNFYHSAPAVDVGTITTDSTGYVVGAGVAQALTENISARAEYLYYDFGTTTGNFSSAAYPTGYTLQGQNHTTMSAVRVGLDFGF